MQTIIAENWIELQDILFANSWKENLKRYRSDSVYRGSPGGDEIEPDVTGMKREAYTHESHLLRNFIKYADTEGSTTRSIWSWLALAQHHGLPTRLLDWTYSPYVALHFATKDAHLFSNDGHVLCVNYHYTNRWLPAKLKKILKEEGSDVFTVEMLDRASKSLAGFDALSKKEFVLFFEPPSLDDRIVNQYALFSLISRPDGNLWRWLEAHDEASVKITIPAGLKREIRDKLDQANITERTISPGLDGLCAWLKRYYSLSS